VVSKALGIWFRAWGTWYVVWRVLVHSFGGIGIRVQSYMVSHYPYRRIGITIDHNKPKDLCLGNIVAT